MIKIVLTILCLVLICFNGCSAYKYASEGDVPSEVLSVGGALMVFIALCSVYG